uniref:Uncharacterized protein n=1 Tax=Anguilla anguilla TaxID=7936 RepID=A0A0E9X068_ANGAN
MPGGLVSMQTGKKCSALFSMPREGPSLTPQRLLLSYQIQKAHTTHIPKNTDRNTKGNQHNTC